ncbi:MAG: FemAB family PEP-CTERM system-associated protein [Gemmatimonadota bacterium]|nr:MAG: FemAB family PEP-CTERM system-associated protein [Gemmatimonadota bacterium]
MSAGGDGDSGLQIAQFQGAGGQWDELVRSQTGWTHFHLHGWKQVVENVFRHECLYLSACDAQGRLTGVLPLVRVRSRVFGHFLISMPFLNYGGPLGSATAVRRLTDHATELARESGAGLLELRSTTELDVDLPVSHRKVTLLLDLPPDDPTQLWDGFKAKLRSQIRRPRKEGVVAKFGLDQLDSFFGVFSHHMRDLGTPTQPRRLFQEIARAFPESVWFGCAYLGDKAVAAGCGFQWNGEFEMTWAASLVEYNRIAPNMLLYWSFLERAVSQGLHTFNFGRCTPGSGTHRFKRQWGAREVPLWWYQYHRRGEASTPSPDDARYSWGPRIWKHLPLRIANAAGPRIVRFLP